MPPRQTKYGHMQPPVERLASLVSPRVGAYPGPPLGRITDQCRAPGSRPRYPARREGAAPRTRPSSVWVPHSRVFRRPSLVSVHKSLIKQARATFPLIPPQVRGKLKGMQIQGSAREVSPSRSGWGAPISSYPAEYPARPGFSGARVEGGGGGRGGTRGGRLAPDLEVMHNSTA